MSSNHAETKKVLLISPTAGKAGVDVCFYTLVIGLDKSLFQPIIIIPANSFFAHSFRQAGIRVYELPLQWWFPIGITVEQILKRLTKMEKIVTSIVEIIKKENCELVFSNSTVSLDGAIAAALAGVPHIVHMHAQFVDNIYTTLSTDAKNYIYRLFSKSANRVVCCSSTLHNNVKHVIENSCYISNGVDAQEFSMKYRDYKTIPILKLLTVGHYNANKQQVFVLNALLCLKNKNEDYLDRLHFSCVGPSEESYLRFLQGFLKKHNLTKYVTFKPFCNSILDVYWESDVYINSSITESLPLSVMEAMSTGLPIIATINDGNSLLVNHGENGWLCPNPDDMADTLIMLLDDRARLEHASVASRKIIEEKLSHSIYIKSFEQLFSTTIKDKKLPCSTYEIKMLFNALTIRPILFPSSSTQLHILVIFPHQASATYSLCAEEPLNYLKERYAIQYKAIELSEISDKLLSWADIIYCVRYFNDTAHAIIQEAHKAGKPFVWYIDDNYSAITFVDGRPTHLAHQNNDYERMYLDSDAVFVNNIELKILGSSLNENTHLFPCYQLVLDQQSRSDNSEQPIKFGFMGTLGRDDDFSFVVPAIQRILDEYNDRVRVEFIGYCPKELLDYEQVVQFDFIHNYRSFLKFFASRRWDFALAPLQDTQFNKSKTNNKYREYSAQHLPGIYSNISTYSGSIIDGVTGNLVENSVDAWHLAIKEMIDNREGRKRIAENAFIDIETNYNIEKFAIPLLTEILKVCQERSWISSVPDNHSNAKNFDSIHYQQRQADWEVFKLFWKRYGVLTLFIAAWKILKRATQALISIFKRKQRTSPAKAGLDFCVLVNVF